MNTGLTLVRGFRQGRFVNAILDFSTTEEALDREGRLWAVEEYVRDYLDGSPNYGSSDIRIVYEWILNRAQDWDIVLVEGEIWEFAKELLQKQSRKNA